MYLAFSKQVSIFMCHSLYTINGHFLWIICQIIDRFDIFNFDLGKSSDEMSPNQYLFGGPIRMTKTSTKNKTLNSKVWVKEEVNFGIFYNKTFIGKLLSLILLFKPTKWQWNPPVVFRSHNNDNNNNNNRAFLPFAVAGIPIDLLWFCYNICSVKLSIENVMMNKRDERKEENNEGKKIAIKPNECVVELRDWVNRI